MTISGVLKNMSIIERCTTKEIISENNEVTKKKRFYFVKQYLSPSKLLLRVGDKCNLVAGKKTD